MHKIKWLLQKLTPLSAAVFLCLIGIVISFLDLHASGGWSMIGVIYLTPLMLALAAIDSILIFFLKKFKAVLFSIEFVILIVVFIAYRYFE